MALSRFQSLAVLATALAFVVAAAAAPAGYTTRLWQTEDGLPQNSVTAIVQTRDGYLWVGTYGGLARFDGVRFEVFEPGNTPALVDSRIVSLYEDREGVLWIGHDSGLISRYAHGRFDVLRLNTPSHAERVVALSSDAAGAVWVLRENGVVERVTGQPLTLPRTRTTRPQVLSMVRASDGTLYVDEDGSVYRIEADREVPIPALQTGSAEFALGIGGARAGGVWVARGSSLERWTPDGSAERRAPAPWATAVSVGTVAETRDGGLAIGTIDRGLYLWERGRAPAHFDHSNGLTQDWIRALCEDREGNLWLGAGSGGLVEIVPTAFSIVAPPEGWGGRTELAVMVDHAGALWVGTEGAGLYRLAGGRWSHFGGAEGLAHDFVWSIGEAADQLYVGTWGGGLFRREGERFARVSEYDPDAGPVLALNYDPAARELWIGGAAGLLRWRQGDRPHPVPGIGGSSRVCAIARDSAGALWFGGPAVGLARLEGDAVTRYGSRELGNDTVLCLKADSDGTLWIGTGNGGLVRYREGRFAAIRMENGLPSNVVCHIAEDAFGYFWMSTHHGLVRVARRDLDRCADGQVAAMPTQAFDRNDGLPTIEFSAGLDAAGCTSPDGRIWFTSSKGLVEVDPAKIRANPLPPPVVLEAVQIDGRRRPFDEGRPALLRLAPDHQRIEFQYTALSLTAPGKVAFKYRLDGIDQGWVDAGTKRSASYSRLPAGRYTFRVIACNNDGVWNGVGASLACVVLPFFWETWWFATVVVAVVLAAVIWAVRHFTRRRLQRRLELLERRHAIERERARIARDIHDDIGSTLTRITMLSQCLPRDGPASGAAAIVEQIYDTAREATRALDEIVWAVNPRHDSLEGFVTYMGKFAQDYLAPAGIRCRLDLPVKLPQWPLTADMRHNLFLAFKEALNNVVKHSGATEVRVSLRAEEKSFVLNVEDNGRGFRPEAAPAPSADRPAAGNGLANLRRRLAAIGGSCEITSAPGHGTHVSFRVAQRASDQADPLAADPATSSPETHL